MPRLSKIGAAALAAFGWTGLASVSASYLVVAGGGGGAGGNGAGTNNNGGGAGGAGGLLTGTASLNPTLSYTITVGAGGTGGIKDGSPDYGTNGSSSALGSIATTTGGGRGGGRGGVGQAGGSGGGGGGGSGSNTGAIAGGSATSGQGFAGGSGYDAANGTQLNSGGGGGGASAVGANASSGGAAGNGGAGTASSISGSSVTYAGGGGGGATNSGTAGSGGAGGGGAGTNSNTNATSGTANLGGGGGGGGANGTSGANGGSGGSGVVIISYSAPQKFGGGIVTTSGSNVIHTFNTSGTLTPLSSLTASYLIVAGGGGSAGNRGGGGGGGGMLTGSGLTIDTNSNYVVVVGAGGAGALSNASVTSTQDGSSSSFSAYNTSATGGGGGAGAAGTGRNGGSGGGGGGSTSVAGSGGTGNTPSTSPSQGTNGGTGVAFATGSFGAGGGGGGGGASGVAGSSGSGTSAGNGGNGTSSSISGTATYYAGGGGGGGGGANSSGGLGGGGAGSWGGTGLPATQVPGTNGTANTGGGAGGGSNYATTDSTQASGGSGIVIISYAGSTQQMAGGTVTISGGNVIHTFTSSGYLTPIKYVNNSLRFRSSASAYLSRTPASATNRKTWTWSGWVKRGILGSTDRLFCAGSGSTYTEILTVSDTIKLNGQIAGADNGQVNTVAVFRDPSAWYHIVVAFDVTASTKIIVYINGVSQTLTTTTAFTNQNYEINNTVSHNVGNFAPTPSSGDAWDGYLTEINFIDGQALTPNSFGTFNSYGVWQPITYGGSYGTNGFYLPFTGSSSYYGSFNGSTQYLQTGNATNLALGTGDFTIEGWFNRASGTNNGVFQLSTASGGFQAGNIGNLALACGSGILTYYAAGASTNTASLTITNGAWNHFALVRSGTTTTLYYNGVSVSSISDSTNYTATYLVVGGYYSTTYVWNGQISNFRVVKGTALYTSNFTPTTSPLTAVTGTQFLTLQSSTIVDNSTNAYAITNNGTVATTQAYPFTMLAGQAKDYSPAGNNWTNNNIGVLSGSTLDIMTDVPTLTSATAANYCVLNPLDKNTNMSPSSGNLDWVNSGATQYSTRSTIFPTSGKWYAEFTISSSSAIIAIANQDAPVQGLNGLNGVYAITTQLFNNSGTAAQTGLASFVASDVIAVAYDAGANSVQFYRNNSTFGTALTPSATGPFCFFVGANGSACTINANFGQRPFTYTPPSGYVALNTYNL